jgi:hypothetical protein
VGGEPPPGAQAHLSEEQIPRRIVYPLSMIWQDFRYGLRSLRKQPSFTLLAVVALALGIGAATTIFSAIHGVLLDPFPYTNASRVVQIMIHDVSSSRPGGRTYFTVPEYLDFEQQNHVFEEMIGGTFEDILVPNGEGTDQYQGGGLLMRGFVSLQQVDLGFDPHNLLLSRPPLPKGQYKTAAADAGGAAGWKIARGQARERYHDDASGERHGIARPFNRFALRVGPGSENRRLRNPLV